MSTSRGFYKFRRVYGAFKCHSGNLFLQQPGGGRLPPTFPKWLLPLHYPGLKLKTGRRREAAWWSLQIPSVFPRGRFSAALTVA